MSIISDIDGYISQNGGHYPRWYCGIAADPEDRLFNAHQVENGRGCWIYADCGTDAAARRVEQHFHQKGCQGAGGGGDRNTRHVYAYKITSSSREDV